MVFTPIKFVLICVLMTRSSALSLFDFKVQALWKASLALLAFIDNPLISQANNQAEPDPILDKAEQLKRKMETGRKLLDELNENLEKMMKSYNDQTDIDEETFEKIIKIKDGFQKLKEAPGGAFPKAFMNEFREKALRAFQLILKGYGAAKMAKPQHIEEIQDVDNQVDKDDQKRFDEEL